jgi:hypothetical protein
MASLPQQAALVLRLLADEFGRALFEKSRDAFAKIFGSSGQALHPAFEIELLLV